MGVIDAPQWLLPAFSRSVRALGTTAPAEQIRAAGEHLVSLWSTPDRRFHNLRHLIDMLARVDELADESHNPDIMRVATWYHGCMFSAEAEQVNRRNGGEDEAASAAFAAQDLRELGVPDKAVERVCCLIVNLKRHTLSVDDIDAMALIDADLGTLAVDPQTYKEYLRLLREEYAHIPQADYLRARLAITSRLLGRDRLFHSPLGQRWEPLARENLEAEGRRVAAMLAALRPEEAAECARTESGSPAEPGPQEQAVPVTPALSSSLTDEPDDGAERRARAPRSPDAAGEYLVAPVPDAPAAKPSTVSPSSIPPAPAPSASTPRTPARGVPAPAEGPEAPPAKACGIAAPLSHAPSMESCAEDLEQLLGSPRPGQERCASRHDLAQEESARLAEKLRLKAEAAKIAREARTGEIAPITEEIVDDGADRL
ncbi:hypothetical protein J5X07_11115 [Actinomyces bowdenii]|uniref:Metal-dependent phosphohydrolase n=1 Tax=Actinomyces bowdenii TaxID=131109 RepID=A0A3P1V4X9_9ACTO|nr:hypothetical protein [Actinomyces bowdenii]MBO3725567.1 hypothetical protein [Actinomyces bowdenii]RRD29181.1 hypothetical protein EII10_07420 [Actinomyces bowdenii]